MYSLTDSGVYGKQLKSLGVEVVSLHFSKYNFFIKTFKLTRLLKETNSEIIQTWLYHSDFIGGIIAFLMGSKKIIWNIRGSYIGFKLNKFHTYYQKFLKRDGYKELMKIF